VMADEFVELFEGAFVEQQVNSFARGEFSLLVLAFAALCSAARFGFGVQLAQLFQAVVMSAMFSHGNAAVLLRLEIVAD
jgi:hypothetical protein